MTNRFYVPEIKFENGFMVLGSQGLVNQLNKVLRVKTGEKLYLFDNSGMEYETKVHKINPSKIEVRLLNQSLGKQEVEIHITLYQALLKKDRWVWLLQKVTELGVAEIVPFMSEFCIADQISDTKRERYEKILTEATEQCGGCKIPKLGELQDFEQVVKSIQQKNEKAFLFHPNESAVPISQAVQGLKEVGLLVGPEGGFSPKEVELAKSAGIQIASLGKRILRAETAGIIAVGLVLQST